MAPDVVFMPIWLFSFWKLQQIASSTHPSPQLKHDMRIYYTYELFEL